jgi:hypothetical protein
MLCASLNDGSVGKTRCVGAQWHHVSMGARYMRYIRSNPDVQCVSVLSKALRIGRFCWVLFMIRVRRTKVWVARTLPLENLSVFEGLNSPPFLRSSVPHSPLLPLQNYTPPHTPTQHTTKRKHEGHSTPPRPPLRTSLRQRGHRRRPILQQENRGHGTLLPSRRSLQAQGQRVPRYRPQAKEGNQDEEVH